MSQTSGMKIEHEGQLGWPLPKRRDHFHRHETANAETHRVELMGELKPLPIIRVSIDLPRYRFENGRTASAQQEYLAGNQNEPADLFTRDPESDHAQFVQHVLLSRLLDAKGLLAYFRDSSHKQTEPMILDENGFVINGNRRLCAWRTLYWKDPESYQRYAYLDGVVLPHCDKKAIAKLEASLQVEPDIKASYTWDSLANMMLDRQAKHSLSTKELAELYRLKEKEVKELLDMRDYAEKYLESRNTSHQWSRVSDDEYAFQQLVKHRQKTGSPGSKELFAAIAFTLIDDPEGGRLYQAIPAAWKYLKEIRLKLSEKFPVEASASPQGSSILGPATNVGSDFALAQEISKAGNVPSARDIIRESVETQKALEKDRKSVNVLIERLARANGLLVEAAASGLRPESKREGVEDQLLQIEESIAKIRHWLDNA